MGLREYRRKRDFAKTPEPDGSESPRRDEEGGRSFVIQKHAASHLHYDFRLELGGVLKSWSVPKGPSLDPTVKRLAMHTEDHPLEYGDFEGIIPKGQYGGGTVMVWDRGTWAPVDNPHKGYYAGKLKFTLHGEKLRGGFTLVKTRGQDARDDGRSWLLIKEDDAKARPQAEFNVVEARPDSAATGRSLDEIAADRGRVWISNRAAKDGGGGETPGRPASRAKTRARTKTPARAKRTTDAAQIARRVRGAKEATLAAKVRPELPKPADEPPPGDDWLHEIQYDGCRVMARVDGGRVTLLSHDGDDWTSRYPTIADAVSELRLATALLDGEVTVLLRDGTTTAPRAPRARSVESAGRPKQGELVYFAFDLLYLEGYDLRRAALEARKQALESLLGPARAASGPLRYSGHIVGSGDEVYQKGCKLALKGIVSKRRDAPYKPGRGAAWVRVACRAARRALAKGRKLTARKKTAHKAAPSARKPAPRPTRAKAGQPGGTARHGVRLTHPDRVLFPAIGATKLDLARFYESIADRILPHVRGRPLTLVRCPEGALGECIYMKHSKTWGPSPLRRVDITEKTKVGEYLVADSVDALIVLVQMDVLEIHTWSSVVDALEQPDRIVFDLDPDPSVGWDRVIEAARLVRSRLGSLGLESFVKTTGGKGLHVVVPVEPLLTWDDLSAFARAVATGIARDDPGRYTVTMSKALRKGKIFLDYLRNTRGNTSVAAFSTRARPNAPVSVPLAWEELSTKVRSDHYTIQSLPQRLAAEKTDPWARYWTVRQTITAARMVEAGLRPRGGAQARSSTGRVDALGKAARRSR